MKNDTYEVELNHDIDGWSIAVNGETILECLSEAEAMNLTYAEAIHWYNANFKETAGLPA